MRFPLASTSALLSLITHVLATDLTLYLPATLASFTLPPTTHATLTSLRLRASAPLSAVNTFTFRDLAPGSYLLDVHCDTDGFQPLRVDVGADGSLEAWETFRGNDWENKGERQVVRDGSVGTGVELRALGGKIYFLERPRFSVLTILKNPMILMGLATMGLVFGMPKLLENMDPELKAEFEERQKEGPMASVMGGGQPAANPLANFDMAAYLAGSGKKDSGSSAASKDQGGVKRE